MKFNYYRNFGSLSNDSVVTDIYNKKYKKRLKKSKVAKGKKCKTRLATEGEIEKYNIKIEHTKNK